MEDTKPRLDSVSEEAPQDSDENQEPSIATGSAVEIVESVTTKNEHTTQLECNSASSEVDESLNVPESDDMANNKDSQLLISADESKFEDRNDSLEIRASENDEFSVSGNVTLPATDSTSQLTSEENFSASSTGSNSSSASTAIVGTTHSETTIQTEKPSTSTKHSEAIVADAQSSSGLAIVDEKQVKGLSHDQEPNPEPSKNVPSTIKRSFAITLEPAMFLFMLASSFTMVSLQNLTTYKICHVVFNYTEQDCLNFSNSDAELKHQVTPMATNYGMYRSLIETMPGVIFALFMGPWSDRNGRLVPIMLPMIGSGFSTVVYVFCSYYPNSRPEYLFISWAIYGLSGGMISLMMGAFSYISDITSKEGRTMRIAILDSSIFIALPIGLIVSGLIYDSLGFVAVFSISCGISALSLLYVLIFVRETIVPEQKLRKNVFGEFFSWSNVTDMLRVCFKRRDGHVTAYILLLIASMAILIMPFVGESSVAYYFVSKKFNWNQTQYSYYSAYTMAVSIVGLVTLLPVLMKKFKLPDVLLGSIGITGRIINSVLIAFCSKGWMMYAASAMAFTHPLSIPVVRSLISKLVDQEDLGKVFALLASCESVVPLFSSVIYTQVFNATFELFSGTVYLLSAGVMIIPLVIFGWIHFDLKKSVAYKRLESDIEENKSPSIQLND